MKIFRKKNEEPKSFKNPEVYSQSSIHNNDNSENKADDNLEKHVNSEAPVDAN